MVLTDYCMPEMTGYDLLKAIKVTHLLLQPHELTSIRFLFSVELYIN
jgi:CheY-like chemotaxis protein